MPAAKKVIRALLVVATILLLAAILIPLTYDQKSPTVAIPQRIHFE